MKVTVPPFLARRSLRAGIFLCLLPLLGAVSCFSPQDAATSANNAARLPGSGPADTYRVRASETSFYHLGPLQASGPDEQLKKDTELVMLTPNRVYSRVKTSNGDTGYVATEDIGPLTSGEIASANVAAGLAANGTSVQAQLESQRQVAARAAGGDGYTIPPEAGNQEKLPEPDARATGPRVNTHNDASPTPDPLFHR